MQKKKLQPKPRKPRLSLDYDEVVVVSLWRLANEPLVPFERRVEALQRLGGIVVGALKQLGTASERQRAERELMLQHVTTVRERCERVRRG